MTRERFLTVGWNNVLTLVLGLVVLIYVVLALSGTAWAESGGLIVLGVLGALY